MTIVDVVNSNRVLGIFSIIISFTDDDRHGLELRLVREDHERGHEQDAPAHAEEAARHSRGESEREQAEEVHQKISTAADATSRATKAPATTRSEIRC